MRHFFQTQLPACQVMPTDALFAKSLRASLLTAVFCLSLIFVGASAHAVTYVVTLNTVEIDGSDNQRTLPEALDEANNSPGADTIVFNFDANLAAGTIILEADEPFTVSDNLSIDGSGLLGNVIEVDEQNYFKVGEGKTLSLSNMTIVIAGDAAENEATENEAAIYAKKAVVNLTEVLIQDDEENGRMRALTLENSSLSIVDSEIRNMKPDVDDDDSLTQGAAIYFKNSTANSLSIVGSEINNNASKGNGGAVFLDLETGSDTQLILTDNKFINNQSKGSGGAISVTLEGVLAATVSENQFDFNSAQAMGGAFSIESEKSADIDISLDKNSLYQNLAGDSGGAIGFLLGGSDFGAIDLNAVVSNTTFSENTSGGNGGAIAVKAKSFSLVGLDADKVNVYASNCTLANNSAAGEGGAFSFEQDEGLLDLAFNLINCTVFGNHSNSGGGAILLDMDIVGAAQAEIKIHNSVLAGSTELNEALSDFVLAEDLSLPEEFNPVGESYSPVEVLNSFVQLLDPLNASLLEASSLTGLDPLLGDLADNGGSTDTISILANSPLIDGGDNALALDSAGEVIASDQRGLDRVFNEIVDMGAFEVNEQSVIEGSDAEELGESQEDKHGGVFGSLGLFNIFLIFFCFYGPARQKKCHLIS